MSRVAGHFTENCLESNTEYEILGWHLAFIKRLKSDDNITSRLSHGSVSYMSYMFLKLLMFSIACPVSG